MENFPTDKWDSLVVAGQSVATPSEPEPEPDPPSWRDAAPTRPPARPRIQPVVPKAGPAYDMEMFPSEKWDSGVVAGRSGLSEPSPEPSPPDPERDSSASRDTGPMRPRAQARARPWNVLAQRLIEPSPRPSVEPPPPPPASPPLPAYDMEDFPTEKWDSLSSV